MSSPAYAPAFSPAYAKATAGTKATAGKEQYAEKCEIRNSECGRKISEQVAVGGEMRNAEVEKIKNEKLQLKIQNFSKVSRR